ncbi:putative protein FAR1-RELATED SEQUENCE 10 isoform X3 [Triticum dicoccoides]|uniref:putative protein FAR1-RELATED SEQUENCE 10 isoform X3 n=1 Tax=Triticum dicoccoides TaxID=85692 RepID=UPI00188E4224|nr:putative protein FAR1-RELATED SEQUENCE 10 isoform X3 [Triticum dicoccoides]
MESAGTEISFTFPGSGSGASNGCSGPAVSPDSPRFARHPGSLGAVCEVTEDDPSGRFPDLLDTVEAVLRPDASDSEENKASRAENVYVALDDKVGWVSRKRRDVMPDERPTSADRVTTLEKALTGFADRDSDSVVTPSVGLSFDSINEAYEFYNLYSWECGFGVRYAKSRMNVKGAKCMQEFICCCSGKPKEANSKSTWCQCQAMIRLLRTNDEGWYINEFRSKHNHPMLNTCAEKLHFPSHRHIDKYTRELVSQLRQNNVNLSKVYSIIATFFGRVENVPFTKRCLRTLCGKLSREQADDDVRKTMAIFFRNESTRQRVHIQHSGR